MTTISSNLQAVNARIAAACVAAGRDPATVGLLAVSKTWSAAAACARRGGRAAAFGESYVQEAVPKLAALADLDLEWHFIGPLQSNKTRPVAEHFAWVHSVERLKIAERLVRPAARPPAAAECLRAGECQRRGQQERLRRRRRRRRFAMPLRHCPDLRLRGLMAIPEPGLENEENSALARRRFAQVRELRDVLARRRSGARHPVDGHEPRPGRGNPGRRDHRSCRYGNFWRKTHFDMKITFIGGGNMATALIGGMKKAGLLRRRHASRRTVRCRAGEIDRKPSVSVAYPPSMRPR